MTPPPLPLRRMSELDLNGILFVNFPASWSLSRSRSVLEQLIRRNGDTEISAATVITAFVMESMRNNARLPEQVRRERVAAAWEARRKRLAERGITTTVPRQKPLQIKIEEWSF